MNFGIGFGPNIFNRNIDPGFERRSPDEEFGAGASLGISFGGFDAAHLFGDIHSNLTAPYAGNSQQKWTEQAGGDREDTSTPMGDTPRAGRFVGSVNAHAPQSGRDTTPSGRKTFRDQNGIAPMSALEWGAQFSGPVQGVAAPRAPGQPVPGQMNSWDANYPKANLPLGRFPSTVLGVEAQSRFDTKRPSGAVIVPDEKGNNEAWISARGKTPAQNVGQVRWVTPGSPHNPHLADETGTVTGSMNSAPFVGVKGRQYGNTIVSPYGTGSIKMPDQNQAQNLNRFNSFLDKVFA